MQPGQQRPVDVIAWRHSRRGTETTVTLAVDSMGEEKLCLARDLQHPWIALADSTPCKYNAS
jgi:hypothetical protein